MPLAADKTITVVNLRYDPESDEETEVRTRITPVSVHARTVATATADGLQAASLAQVRIFEHTSLCAPQTPSGAFTLASSKFVEPGQWAAQSAESAALAWTLRPGDKIEYAGQALTILAVHDNRGAKRHPHWYVEAR